MLLSMTGYGIAHRETDRYTATVEIKSLNSKTLDLSLRLPRFLQDRELEVRNLLAKSLIRGKVNLNFEVSRTAGARAATIFNREALLAAYQEVKTIAEELGLPASEETLLAALRLPGVLAGPDQLAEPEVEITWDELLPLVHEALERINQFRRDEGQALTTEILGYIDHIRVALADVERHDPTRITQVRQRLQNHLSELAATENFNASRFEQEVLYYIEKLDIAEEKVRLINHLHYFTETVYLPEPTGKKLAFISQEIGREINTIGSKANDSTIQHLVVSMKEELEKIKEQINNIL
ncbi:MULTISPECIES: YicC/YloC family endoribonuclease [Hymenobacter]|uniref:YicC family protein n=2 Tax=Hymenobacter TaxID=89966 RepID=A0ABS6WUT5_9BACT|nr:MULTISPECIES: YicC/YloC family endoribonuclease [Hymenobacter]MBO3269958.1 YicC family protein [Hymenobacter defluvii]MBW3127335.1 YicC family protein [Hymenobacter profundi]